jgi:cleavage and polyadenylation specificity factor subunit 1
MPTLPDPFGEAMEIDPSQPLHQILCTTQTGTIALITPLTETSYRRLGGLATFLNNTLDNACGLNPRAFRAADNDLVGAGGTRGIIDGNLLLRWGELGELKKKDGLGKIGGEEWLFAGEREILVGRGLFGLHA